jgi:hypothetical protein
MRLPRTATLVVLVLALALAALVPAAAVAGYASFKDGPFGVHEDGVDWLSRSGVTAGCTPSEFCPADPVTRAQMATFLHRLSGRAGGVAPSVDAATLEGRRAGDLEVVNGFVRVVEKQRHIDSVVEVEARCPEGTQALGGGGMIDGLFAQYMGGPSADGQGWFLVWVSDDYRTHEVDASVVVGCAPAEAGVSSASASTDEDRSRVVTSLRAQVEQRRQPAEE